MLAEDSSAWPAVTSPTYQGGLGFNFKWNMGWMNDMLRYMALDPYDRPHHHHLITFSLLYAFSENYVLPLSHDEVVHGKRSLLNKMPGSYEEKFAQLRLFYGFWMSHPGKKLLFMGSEWGQFDEWKDADMLDWMVLDYDSHQHMHHYVRTLNHMYLNQPSLWERDSEPDCFEWIDVHNAAQSVISFIRRGNSGFSIIIANFSRNDYQQFRIGVPEPGSYRSFINSNDKQFGGTETQTKLCYSSENVAWHGHNHSIIASLTTPYVPVFHIRTEGIHIERELVSMGRKEMIAMLLAGGEGKRLGVLTKDLAKPAVYFGGKYRIIDFTLSNCAHSGIDTVGVLTQYQPLELNRYLGIGSPWGLDRRDGGMTILPPYMKQKGGVWYKGTANAIYQNMGFIEPL